MMRLIVCRAAIAFRLRAFQLVQPIPQPLQCLWVSRQVRRIPRPLQRRAPTWLSMSPAAIALIVFPSADPKYCRYGNRLFPPPQGLPRGVF
jgi:hypothetical protein